MSVQNLIYDNLLSKCNANHSTVVTINECGRRMQLLFAKCMSSENRTIIMDNIVENGISSRKSSVFTNAGISSTSNLKDFIDLYYLTKYLNLNEDSH